MPRLSKTGGVALTVVLLAAACSGSTASIPDSDASSAGSDATTGGGDSGNGGPEGGGGADGSLPPRADAGGNADGGGPRSDASTDATTASDGAAGLPFMSPCTTLGTPGDCQPGLICAKFVGNGKYCTRTCTLATSTTDCPAPSAGCTGAVCAPP